MTYAVPPLTGRDLMAVNRGFYYLSGDTDVNTIDLIVQLPVFADSPAEKQADVCNR
jgi:hypothetical protein